MQNLRMLIMFFDTIHLKKITKFCKYTEPSLGNYKKKKTLLNSCATNETMTRSPASGFAATSHREHI